MSDISFGSGSGVDIYAARDGLIVGGWFDSFVGIEPMFVTWAELDELRRKAKRRVPYRSKA